MRKLLARGAIVIAFVLLLGCAGCRKDDERVIVEPEADITNLAVVVARNNLLLGIDTSTFKVKTRIRCRWMHITKAARSESGEVVFVDEDHSRLCVLGTDGHLARSKRIIAGPNSPFVYGDRVCVGSRYFANGGAQINVYDLHSLRGLRRLVVKGLILREEDFSGADGKIYTYSSDERSVNDPPEAFPVMIDARTLDTANLQTGYMFRGDKSGGILTLCSAAQGKWLFVASDTDVALYDLEERRFTAHRSLEELYDSLKVDRFSVTTKPVIADGFAYMLCIRWAPGEGRAVCWVKFSMDNLEIVDAKRLFVDGGTWYGADDFFVFGRYYVVEAILRERFRATFIDIRTGKVVAKVMDPPGVQ